MIIDYYIALNGQPVGPMTLEEILNKELSPETLVWKTGLESWVKASELPELAPAFETVESVEPEERKWYAMIGGTRQIGPLSAGELIKEGLNSQTPVWTAGMADWLPAYTQPELEQKLNQKQRDPGGVPPNPYHEEHGNFSRQDTYRNNPYQTQGESPRFADNPQYNNNYYYNNRQYRNPYDRQPDNRYPTGMRTNWLPWAIGATVAGFFCSCIGAIFGIIGIVQANKANTLYSQGYDNEADRANGNAKIMTIIGYIFAGIGILFTILFKGFYSSFLNF